MRLIAVLAVATAVSGCATMTPEVVAGLMKPIWAASTRNPAELKAEAEAGKADAQYAYAIILEHGLQGVQPDKSGASLFRRKALATRGTIPLTTYIAGLNGAPGRVAIINTPRYDFTGVQAVVIERCIAALSRASNSTTEDDAAACGGPENFGRLQAAWSRAGSPG